MTKTKQRPAHSVKDGRVEVAIWRHENAKGVNYSLAMSRSYKKDDAWRRTSNFFADDLFTLIALLHEARKWIREQQRLDGREGIVDLEPEAEGAAA